ncbi:HugZ family pyridoxamine 5'-phosphate oxidase [Marinobacterium jannaschii]|uniref:HugZ family pyridoxamine 5'-phosphate oxidase n=1 Tax=Marinobacterium jannaschii TaxID=64970 RepID=UPI00048138BA|nr:pyridoxamine 5'-phosphate oxidase family protein [Marinobacterium jannaschii]
MSQENSLQAYQRSCHQLISDRQSLLLATVNCEEAPDISYAPYIRDGQGAFYIFVSRLATHTLNLLHSRRASVLFIREESESRNLFARERLSFRCQVTEITPQDTDYKERLDQMEQQLGNTVAMLRSLPDFHLLCLIPEQGRYVVGFGKAFDVDPKSGELSHIDADRLQQGRR